jgi:Family of unknown function (DUF5681)
MNSKGTPENLRPAWRKGDPSPNPSGRPRRLPISDMYARIAVEPIPESIRNAMKRNGVSLPPEATFAEALATRVWVKALSGDSGAAREIREAIEGRTGQRAILVDESPSEVNVPAKDNGANARPIEEEPDSTLKS